MAEPKTLLEQFAAAHQDKIDTWKAESEAAGRKAERDRFAGLLSAFPGEPGFIIDRFAAGDDAGKAAAPFADVLRKRLADKDAQLAAANEAAAKLAAGGNGHPGVPFNPTAPPKPGDPGVPDESRMSFAERTKSRWDRNADGCKDTYGADGFGAFERFQKSEENVEFVRSLRK